MVKDKTKQVKVLLISNDHSKAAFKFVQDLHTRLVELTETNFYKSYKVRPPTFVGDGEMTISDLDGNEVVFRTREAIPEVKDNYGKIVSGKIVNNWGILTGLGLEEADLNQNTIIVDCLLGSPSERALLKYVLDIYKKSVETAPFELYDLERLAVKPEDWPGVTDDDGGAGLMTFSPLFEAELMTFSPLFEAALRCKVSISAKAFYRAGEELCCNENKTLRALGVLLTVAAVLMQRG